MFETEVITFDTREECLAEQEAICQGLRNIGSGLYAMVYATPDPAVVLKVIKYSDPGYMAYLEVMKRLGEQMRYMPKILRVVEFRYRKDVLEEEPPIRGQLIWLEKLSTPRLTRYDGTGLESYPGNDLLDPPVKRFVDKIKIIIRRIRQGEKVYLRPVHQDLIAMLELVLEVGKSSSSSGWSRLDLHSWNVMVRGKQFIITDPLI